MPRARSRNWAMAPKLEVAPDTGILLRTGTLECGVVVDTLKFLPLYVLSTTGRCVTVVAFGTPAWRTYLANAMDAIVAAASPGPGPGPGPGPSVTCSVWGGAGAWPPPLGVASVVLGPRDSVAAGRTADRGRLLAVLGPHEVLLPVAHVVAVVQPGWTPAPGDLGPILATAATLSPTAAAARAVAAVAAQVMPAGTWTWLVACVQDLVPLLGTPVPPVDATVLGLCLDAMAAKPNPGLCTCVALDRGRSAAPGFVPGATARAAAAAAATAVAAAAATAASGGSSGSRV